MYVTRPRWFKRLVGCFIIEMKSYQYRHCHTKAVVSSISHIASLATARGIHLWNCWNVVCMECIIFYYSGNKITTTKMGKSVLTHWGRVTHICVSKLTIIGSEKGLSPGRRQAIIWSNTGIMLIQTLGTNFSEISSEILEFSFRKMYLKMSSGKWRPSCLGFNVPGKMILYRHGAAMWKYQIAAPGRNRKQTNVRTH